MYTVANHLIQTGRKEVRKEGRKELFDSVMKLKSGVSYETIVLEYGEEVAMEALQLKSILA